MAGYGWEEYDARQGGREVIHDAGNNLDLTIDFVKVPGGSHGGSWAARVKGTPRADAPSELLTTVLFYASMEGLGLLDVDNEQDDLGQPGTVTIRGQTAELGDFKIDVQDVTLNKHPKKVHPAYDAKPLNRAMVGSMQVPIEHLWQAKNAIFMDMKQEIESIVQEYGESNMAPPAQSFTIANRIRDGNMHVVQKVFSGPFQFEILFSSASAADDLTSEKVTTAISQVSKSFKSRYQEIFKPKSPFTGSKYTRFSEELFSNLAGGIGYFHGDSYADRSYAPEYEEDNEGFWEETQQARARAEISKLPEVELFTSVPSRPFFPRGFLWDEGFHLIPIADWDIELTLEILSSWFKLMDEDGWIAREQILGQEARSKVPPEFQVQYPHYANPPTLFMIIDSFVDKLNANVFAADRAASLREYIRNIYPLLKRHYFWYRRTQFGDIKSYDREAFSTKEAYRWRGRTPRHILPSGLDDYPRPQPPHPGELHTDLISWMGMMTRSLRRLAEALSESDDASEFSTYEKAIIRNIDDLHWSKSQQTFCDATVDEYEESIHVCHKGYISIFPFMTGLLPPDSPRLKPILDLISNPEELWSGYGIRSLSRLNPNYATDEDYWRSPIWVNINYLILKNLLSTAQAKGPCQKQAKEIYVNLRENLVKNVFKEWERTGFAWEQYNGETGEGQRTQHFTGWTSLVVSIMVMPDLSGTGHTEL